MQQGFENNITQSPSENEMMIKLIFSPAWILNYTFFVYRLVIYDVSFKDL